ncbi:hypothetical protein FQA47_023018 [Oryzias melastigma]|uniref:Interleukin 4/13A n=1 Tax=Oryzias melastigma TaxID=30732 RepID=A0A834BZ91_ORYME|nr:hypothetical protein FQA47_023018 [Oryzias melastigma]
MEIVSLLLVSGVVQLFSLAACAPRKNELHLNLKDIITDIEKYNDSIMNEYFVEDVQDLADAGCQDAFFCKVLHILKNHEHFSNADRQEHKIVKNLVAYTTSQNIVCEEKPKAGGNPVKKPIPELLGFLKKCSRQRNTQGRNEES